MGSEESGGRYFSRHTRSAHRQAQEIQRGLSSKDGAGAESAMGKDPGSVWVGASYTGSTEGKTENQRRGLAADNCSHKETVAFAEGGSEESSLTISTTPNGKPNSTKDGQGVGSLPRRGRDCLVARRLDVEDLGYQYPVNERLERIFLRPPRAQRHEGKPPSGD
jgi:hypothetical protein